MAKALNREGMVDVVRAELMAASEGVKLALYLGLHSIILEKEDYRLAFEQFESSSVDLSYNGSLVHEISVMGLSFVRFKTVTKYQIVWSV